MGPQEIFTREPCDVTIEDGNATFHLKTGGVDFRLVMPVAVMLQNVAACHEAIDAWRKRQGADVVSFYRDAEIVRGESQ